MKKNYVVQSRHESMFGFITWKDHEHFEFKGDANEAALKAKQNNPAMEFRVALLISKVASKKTVTVSLVPY